MDAPNSAMAMSGMGVAGAGVSAFGQYKQGQMQQAGYEYNANATMEKMSEDLETSKDKFTHLMGVQRSLYAKAGVDLTSGSPLLIMADTARQAEEEKERIQYSGETEADIQKFYGRNAAFAGSTNAMSTFLTGLGKAGSQALMAEKGVSSPWIK